ncbi:MAG TPA: hypothetical protein VFT55_00480 [Planctomycetota bacterium]|nr:hypothetical protein [Planctomycetota bacterium]
MAHALTTTAAETMQADRATFPRQSGLTRNSWGPVLAVTVGAAPGINMECEW